LQEVPSSTVRLEPTRIEDVPVPELSGLALSTGRAGRARLLAIGDRKTVLAHAELTDEPLDWTVVDLERFGLDRSQLEGIATTADGSVLVLCESPPVVHVLDLDTERVETISLLPGGLDDVFDDSASSGEGLVPLGDRRLLVAQEKKPPLLVEFGPSDDDATGTLQALAAWKVEGVDDISDLAVSGGELYCLSDQSRCIVVVDLPLDPDDREARVREAWELDVPERDGPDGKPEGLVVTDDGTLLVGLDTEEPTANLCWYDRP
jgi:uncharacterized protein YjiK